MMVILLRIEADTREECQLAKEHLQAATNGAVKLGRVRKRHIVKAPDRNRYVAYGELTIPPGSTLLGIHNVPFV